MDNKKDLFHIWSNNSEKIAIQYKTTKITYKVLNEIVNEKLDFFKSVGIKEGDHISLKIVDPLLYCITLLALWKMNVVIIPIDTQIAGDFYLDILNESDSNYLITDTYHKDGKKFFDSDKALQKIIIYYEGQNFILNNEKFIPRLTWEKDNKLEAENGFILLFTSGTSKNGKRKGVLIKKENFFKNAVKVAGYTQITCDDSVLITLPLTYCFALSQLLAHFYVCGKCVLTLNCRITQNILVELASTHVTNYASTPYFYEQLDLQTVSKDSLDFSSLRFFMCSGACLTKNVALNIKKCFPNVILYSNYGQTEAAPRIAYNRIISEHDDVESVGEPLEGVKIAILNDKGQELPKGEVGEIFYLSDTVMEGYYKKNLIDRTKLYDSGDLGYINQNGKLVIVGRSDSMIKINGRKVFKTVLEDRMYVIKCIKSIHIKKERHNYLGEYFVAYIVLKEGYEGNTALQQIREYCKKHFDKYERPKKIVLCDKFKINSNNKVVI